MRAVSYKQVVCSSQDLLDSQSTESAFAIGATCMHTGRMQRGSCEHHGALLKTTLMCSWANTKVGDCGKYLFLP